MPTDPSRVPPGGVVTLRRREELGRYYRLGFAAERISPAGVVMRRAVPALPGGAAAAVAAPARSAPPPVDTLGLAALALGTLALLAWLAR